MTAHHPNGKQLSIPQTRIRVLFSEKMEMRVGRRKMSVSHLLWEIFFHNHGGYYSRNQDKRIDEQ